MKPDAGDDKQANLLLDSIENLDQLLANMKNGKKETTLESLAKKLGINEVDNMQEGNYSGRPPTARHPTQG